MSNEEIRPSSSPNLFSILTKVGRTTAAVAHHFFFNLYVGRPYDRLTDVELDDETLPIQHGRYYTMEHYCHANPCLPAEIDLCAQANILIRRFMPDYLLLHMSAADMLGHLHTSESAEYRTQIWRTDNALARVLPLWQAAGYEIFVTSDHGINADGHHGGNEAAMRDVPLYYFGERDCILDTDHILDQRSLAPTLLTAIETVPAETMTCASILAD